MEKHIPIQDKYPKRIDASPTKEFFIHMLTRDIPLSRAILDLVDNSVDGARKVCPNGNFNNLWIRVELDKDHFKIADNCGGIPVDIARNYAFRFGRPKDAPSTPGSVGQFGVGMKRTFFKLGKRFTVDSTTYTSRFSIDVDIEQWKSIDKTGKTNDWQFEFNTVEENITDISPDEIGTRIEVTKLYDVVSENFSLDNFLSRLKHEMRLAHTLSIEKGLVLTINNTPLLHEPSTLFISENIKPAFVEKSYTSQLLVGHPGPLVKVKFFAGVAERSLHDGGWYVFCNGRLVIRADQTATTIWGAGHNVRQYHPDLAYFRGYAYFDSDDPALLPWTTTKTGVDIDSPVYKNAQQVMIELSKPIITFLGSLAKERATFESGDSTDQTLDNAIKNVEARRTDSFSATPTFVSPRPVPVPPGPRMQKIQYSKTLAEVEKVKQLLNVETFTAVGEKTFEYFLRYEVEE